MTERSPARTILHLVPHTHWDREWYEPFQTFRMKLVELVDDVLDRLDRQPAFRFTLDGQLATVDDYLEVRPEAEARIRRFVAEGRLAIGPWQILMDEFLVSGETIVRNLQRGWARAEELGGAMAIGYLPDMFGHIAQMPQILRRAGIADAVVWRGVPEAVTANNFRWRSPDGSEIRAEYLVGGYGNAAYLFEVPERLGAKVVDYAAAMRDFYGDESVLAMYGTDHAMPLPEMVALIETVNAQLLNLELRVETLVEYLRIATRADRPNPVLVEGEQRSGARANVLMGVTSARIDIKAACARAERALERYAEPFQALYGAQWPERLLSLAWRRVVEDSAHDSICGCSVDAVVEQVLVRFAEAEQIATGLAARAAMRQAAGTPRGAWVALNPTPHVRRDLVELDALVPEAWSSVSLQLGDGRTVATQEIARNRPLLHEAQVAGWELPLFFERRMHGRELFGRNLNRVSIEQGEGVRTVTLDLDHDADPVWLDVDELKQQVETAVSAAPEERWLLRVVAAPRRTLQAIVEAPPLESVELRVASGTGEQDHPVVATTERLGNGLVDVSLGADGTLRIRRDGVTLDGVGRLVDGGDHGDSYNYAPPAEDGPIDTPVAIRTELVRSGPVAGELLVTREYDWPAATLEDGSARSPETVRAAVRMAVELRAGEPFVRIRLESVNPATDHRLRVHIPLAQPAERSAAEGQFAVVERGMTIEAGHGEVPLPTFPARGFVDAGGAALLLDHVTEYELVDGRELALTCLRCIGLISRNDNAYREDPAGPERPIPGAQMLGPWSFAFGVYPHAGSWVDSDVVRQAEHYAHPFLVATGRAPAAAGSSDGWPVAHGLSVEGEGVVLSALVRRGDWLELRIVAETPRPTRATIGGGFIESREIDLLGRAGATVPVVAGAVTLDLGAWEIRTIQLRR